MSNTTNPFLVTEFVGAINAAIAGVTDPVALKEAAWVVIDKHAKLWEARYITMTTNMVAAISRSKADEVTQYHLNMFLEAAFDA